MIESAGRGPELVGEAQFRRLLLADTPFIDVRAEIEFGRGSIPGAVNLPILNTAEREQVGRCYKQRGPDEAVALGHRLVDGSLREARIRDWAAFAAQRSGCHVFCWRGGMRSGLAARWMAEAGQPVPVIAGGYKALRRFLMQVTSDAAVRRPLVLIGGRTGAGKTPLVGGLVAGVDLEAHARHRGSSFGRLTVDPPSQIDFEHALALDLLRLDQRSAQGPLFLEDESRRIGAVSIPLELYQAMSQAPLVILEAPFEQRVARILQEYVVDLRQQYEALDPAAGYLRYTQHLLDSLHRIRTRLGAQRHALLRATMEDALAEQRKGTVTRHEDWIAALLRDYYDPMYDYQLTRVQERVSYRGDYDAVVDYCNSYQPAAG